MRICARSLLLLLLLSLPGRFLPAEQRVVDVYDRAGLMQMQTMPGGSFRLMGDIDLADAPWQPIDFSGKLDGNGYAILNMRVSSPGKSMRVTTDGNRNEYDTEMYGLFAFLDGAKISNLSVLGAEVNAETQENCFAAILAGGMADAEIANCAVSGRVTVRAGSTMQGAGGVAGFGGGTIRDTHVEAILTVTDQNTEIRAEEYMGALLACGYADVSSCTVRVREFASVHGYVHNGGLIGMYRVHTDAFRTKRRITGCTVDAEITFFEHLSDDRRAYCKSEVGEIIKYSRVSVFGNQILHFVGTEHKDASVPLLPEMCPSPHYETITLAQSGDAFGFTRYTCQTCGNTYCLDYVGRPQKPRVRASFLPNMHMLWQRVPPARRLG